MGNTPVLFEDGLILAGLAGNEKAGGEEEEKDSYDTDWSGGKKTGAPSWRVSGAPRRLCDSCRRKEA